ncbi:MAG: zinc-binding dehydrogenase, partial [Phycisphaerae bacterium]
MRQAIMTSPGQIEIRDVPEPACAPDQVLVRVRRIGICGSDVHVYHGTHPFTGYPVVQGHEFSGQIVQVGSAVDDPQLRPGVKVTCETQRTCRRCRPCRSGRYHLCDELRVMGFQTPGAAQELVALPAEKVIALPDAFSFDQGALMEPAAVGVHATARAGVNPGDCVLVIGAGPIGMMAALAARARSAATVLISEPSAARRQVARKLGFEQLIDPREQPLPES